MIKTKLFTAYYPLEGSQLIDDKINQFVYENDCEIVDVKLATCVETDSDIVNVTAILLYK